ncbi:glycosyltransferase [Sutcliffiella horikoshii]|uniref:teichuronic acid biosynthesis protein TuaG n=1 Tax=Sutcliffiella horikoshii TaxID=79883 RepID=UPI00384D9661
MSSSLVSVITPSYNAEKFISATIESVRTQTYTNWEMIIVDDCSKDETREILKEYAELDPRIKPIFLEENSGAAVARNTALKAAQGDYVAFLDSDDLWVPDKLEKQLAFMQKNDYAFSFTAYNLMDESGKPLDKVISVPKQIDYKGLLKNTIIGCLTVMIDTRKVEPLQMPLIRTRQDYALWLKVLRQGHVAYGMQEPLANYRIVEGSISSNKLKTAKRNWYVYREIEKLSLPYASWCFVNYAFYAIKKRVQA